MSEEGVKVVREERDKFPVANIILDLAEQLSAGDTSSYWHFVAAFWLFHELVPVCESIHSEGQWGVYGDYNINQIPFHDCEFEGMMEEDWKNVLDFAQLLSADGHFMGPNPPIFDLGEFSFLVYWAVEYLVFALWKRKEDFFECVATDYSEMEVSKCGDRLLGTYEELILQ